MKSIILILALTFLIVSPAYSDECKVRSASQLTNEREVGPITNLVKVKTYGKCVVTFNITVNGVTHRLQETETGMEQEESLCYYARERARKNLLLDLGGFKGMTPPSSTFFVINSSQVSFLLVKRIRFPLVGCLRPRNEDGCLFEKMRPVSSFLMKVSNSYLR